MYVGRKDENHKKIRMRGDPCETWPRGREEEMEFEHGHRACL